MAKGEQLSGSAIVLSGAHENNLKSVTISIPVGSMTCITGVSGSGKSTLVDECLVAEALRRHQILSRSTRRIATAYKPALDYACVPFVTVVRQGFLQWNSRSTVATATGILQRLREVIVRHGEVRSANGPISSLTAEIIASWSLNHFASSSITVVATLERRVLGPVWPYLERALQINTDFSVCLVESGKLPLREGETPKKYRRITTKTHRDIYAIIGELSPVQNIEDLIEKITVAMSLARKRDDIYLLIQEKNEYQVVELQGGLLDPLDIKIYWIPTPSLLSYNSRLSRSGRCEACNGIGTVHKLNEDTLIANPLTPLALGGLAIPYEEIASQYKYFPTLADEIRGLLVSHKYLSNSSWNDISEDIRHEILKGARDKTIQPLTLDNKPKGKRKEFIGLIERVQGKLTTKDSAAIALNDLLQAVICQDCAGTRLNHHALSIYFGGLSFSNILALTLNEAGIWLWELSQSLADSNGSGILKSLAATCDACQKLGLGHLALNRPIGTLSGGESQRLRIAGSLAARLKGGCYVLDEPTKGLHAIDAAALGNTLRDLTDEDTTVLLVEHNPVIVEGADKVIEMGPCGGVNGGMVVYDGLPLNSPLLNTSTVKCSSSALAPIGQIELKGIQCRNIQNESCLIPLGGVVCVTGVSGSGKSTLVRDVLLPALQAWIDNKTSSSAYYQYLSIDGKIDRLIYVSQQGISANPRSLLLTYLGIADNFRSWFFQHSDAMTLDLDASHFSTNTAMGQCPICEGLGRVILNECKIATTCPACAGMRFHPHVLSAKYQDLNIAEWLSLDLISLSENECIPEVIRLAGRLGNELGVGHLSLSRSLPTLSGGECQRLRIVKALIEAHSNNKRKMQHQVFIMDEPAAGLHPADVDRLNQSLHKVVSGGTNTLILIEHNLSIIRNADYVIDVGPLSADQGGKILFSGKVDELILSGPEDSRTRQALRCELPQLKYKSKCEISGLVSSIFMDSGESIKIFRDYLAQSSGECDADEDLIPARPSYLVSAGGNEAYKEQDLFGLIGISLPMYQLFAAESMITDQIIYPDDRTACEAAEVALRMKTGNLAAWFPLTNMAADQAITWIDIRSAIKEGMTKGMYGWFDGTSIHQKISTSNHSPKELHLIRGLVSPTLSVKESIYRAFSHGEGWVSIIDPSTSRIEDFSTRALLLPDLRVGSRWLIPQIFDSGIPHANCILCKGTGVVENIDRSLVISNGSASIDQDMFFTKHALEALKAIRRRSMMPTIKRLLESGLVDLSVPLEEMSQNGRDAFWFGYPDKTFLISGGNKNHKGDWYQWLGLVNYIIANVWKASDRSWSNELNNSRHSISCPRCHGTGLGWEAQTRNIQGVSLQLILSKYTVEQLGTWLLTVDCHTDIGNKYISIAKSHVDLALKLGLGNIRCGSFYNELSENHRLRAFTIACSNNQLLGATAFIQFNEQSESQQLINAIEVAGNMRWKIAN
ncbi:MAG: hypothetical protein WCH01_01015 [Methylococcaceae bacterium]